MKLMAGFYLERLTNLWVETSQPGRFCAFAAALLQEEEVMKYRLLELLPLVVLIIALIGFVAAARLGLL